MATKPKTPNQKWPFLNTVTQLGFTQTEFRECEGDPLHKLFITMQSVSDERHPNEIGSRHVDASLREAACRACCVLAIVGSRKRVGVRYVNEALAIIEAVSPNRAPIWANVLENIFMTAGVLRIPMEPRRGALAILEHLRPVNGLPQSFIHPSRERLKNARGFVAASLLDPERTRWMVATVGETAGGRTKLLSPWQATVKFAAAFGYRLPGCKRDAERSWAMPMKRKVTG